MSTQVITCHGVSLRAIEQQPEVNASRSPIISLSMSEPAGRETLPSNGELHEEPIPVNPTSAVGQLQRWNNPRSNISRVFAAFLSFAIMGATDAAYGVRLSLQILTHICDII